MKLDQEALAHKARLEKIIDQGSKIEALYTYEPFLFWLEWVKRVREELAQNILRGRNLVDKEDWHNRGGYDYLTKIIEASEKFSKSASKARKDLEQFNKDLENIPEALRRAE